MRKIWLINGKNFKQRKQVSLDQANQLLGSKVSVYTSLEEIRQDLADGRLPITTKVLFQRKRAHEYEVFS